MLVHKGSFPILNSLPPGKFCMHFCHLPFFSKINFFEKNLSFLLKNILHSKYSGQSKHQHSRPSEAEVWKMPKVYKLPHFLWNLTKRLSGYLLLCSISISRYKTSSTNFWDILQTRLLSYINQRGITQKWEITRTGKTSSPMGNDRSPWSQHNIWRHHNLRISKTNNSELETVIRN